MRSLAIALLMVLLSGGISSAQSASPAAAQVASAPPATAQDVIDRMLERNSGLASYSVRVRVQTHTNIPFYSPDLQGTAYYKRPDNFAVVFDRVPGYMKGFQEIFTDIGDPIGWEKNCNITLAGEREVDGRSMLELVMTKKIPSDQLKETVAYVDPNTYELTEMDWHYTNGDFITMKQYYSTQDGFTVVSRQHLDAHRRILRGSADSTYEGYQTNVAVSDTVFAKQP